MAEGPLAGVRILDLSRVLAGPWATQLLADLGAEVIKVERPGGGDETRGWGPPWAGDPAAGAPSAYFLCANRGKRSVAVDLARPEGAALVARLAERCDALVENFKVGGLARYGLDYASLSARNPRLVYCSITGFGQDGPYAARPGYDLLIQAMGGLMSITGEPGGEPQKVGVALTDVLTGLYAAVAVLAALRERDRTGRGRHIDLALMDVEVACLANQALNYLVSGEPPRRLGNAHPNIVPYQAFEAADGWFVVAVGNDAQFRRFCDVLGLAGLADEPRFATNAARVRHREALIPLLAARLRERPRAHWVQALEAAAVPAGPINDVADVFADPQVRHRGLARRLTHPRWGALPQVASPIRMDGAARMAEAAPPALGEHTEDVLRELAGVEAGEIARLREAGIIG
ncbi:CaiB/BaiF CoA transferase family protein [Inmirania thermothiophila]|uniref:Crotonobetainyl-CoA:carnitine CoA-transferase CaiB-like acyl-CoA transferase n=1 Tax=Inmirania thermothiophila TaxID=1750597 RepID=A0A3N1Y0U1_9GAMM|nr:CaiB/BaiF CoA-transferase family protein [Inmirania thermothiophila]ROR32455.1 crotonobetainyl-CoA:carnitine CoA-transferase CaiB-like acyl-CoA transferase [Inmirania thermothiophila]